MVAKVISGREVAETILTTDLKNKVIELNKKNIKPKLIVILVGDMKASASYVAQKEKFAVKAGIESDVMRFESSVTESEILETYCVKYMFICLTAKLLSHIWVE